MDGLFEVVFEGRTMPGRDLAEVKAALGVLFKAPPESIERLFSGQAATIKKNLDYASALRYVSAMKETGALARLRQTDATGGAAINATTPPPSAVVTKPTPAIATPVSSVVKSPASPAIATAANPANMAANPSTDTQTTAAKTDWSVAAAGSVLALPSVKTKVDIDTSALSLANVGVTIGEQRSVTPVQIGDLSQYSVAPVGSVLAEKREVVAVHVGDLSQFSVAPVGAAMADKKAAVAAPELDLSEFTLAEVGAKLDTTAKAAPPPPPKTDHLKLG